MGSISFKLSSLSIIFHNCVFVQRWRVESFGLCFLAKSEITTQLSLCTYYVPDILNTLHVLSHLIFTPML